MIDWLNQNSGGVSVILTAAFVLFNGVFVWFTVRTERVNNLVLQEMERQHRDELAPRVLARLEIDWTANQLVSFVLENAGRTRARSLRVSLDQALALDGVKIQEVSFFGSTISLGPGQSTSVVLDASYRLLEKNPAVESLSGRIRFEDDSGQAYEEPYDLSLAALRALRHTQDVSMRVLLDHVHTIDRALESFRRENLD